MAVVASLGCLLWPAAVPAAEDTAIEPVEKWAGVLGGSEVKFHYTVRTTQALEGRIEWSLSVNRRTIQRGQLPLVASAEHVAEATVALKVPEVKEGVILESQLSIAAYKAGGQKPAAEHVKKIWIFPPNPFADRTRWLKDLGITLFDPEGKTADRFEKAGIPFHFTKNTASLDELREGLLVIGEGTAWRDYRSLGKTIVKTAARGVPVLCLAPGEGAIALPGAEEADLPAPSRLSLRREDVIQELDKRLDFVAWPPLGEITSSRLMVKSDRGQVVIEAAKDLRGWSWLEVRWPAPRGRLLIICGFGIIRQWDAGPAPRYLLSELFTRLTTEKLSVLLPQEERED
jgi:hypothetical protein